MARPDPQLGLRENLQPFLLLVLVNAFVGAMVGMERSILSDLAQDVFALASSTAILSFIAVFGTTKAITNYYAGRWGDRVGRKPVLIVGWILALPVAPLLIWAPTWGWVLVANVFLGVSQGLTWSTTVVMKIDLVGPKHRGLAMGFNEFSGYLAVGIGGFVTASLAESYGLRPVPFLFGVIASLVGLALSVLFVRETKQYAELEGEMNRFAPSHLSQKEIFLRASFRDPNLSSVTQGGLVNNLNDGMAWGLFPLVFAAAGMGLAEIAQLVALYPLVWGIAQLVTGGLSDRLGRKAMLVTGMWTQALGILLVSLWPTYAGFAAGSVLLGLGTAAVYPTFLAAISDRAHPAWRSRAVGVYRLWRDLGYPIGALVAGVVADQLGLSPALWVVAGLTFVSGASIMMRMQRRPVAD